MNRDATTAAFDPPPLPDSWELDQQLRHIERILRVDQAEVPRRPGKPSAPVTDDRPWFRVDASHGDVPHRHASAKRHKKAARRPTAARGSSWLGILAWPMLCLGSMALACGGVLWAWSMATGREDLWAVGTPVVLVSQMLLLAGFILQLDRLWQDSREATAKLEHVDRELKELKTAASLRAAAPSPNFYRRDAGGSDSGPLLADLKNQLDQLAMKIRQFES